ncbi:hypothetical protein [Maribacter litoralis]|uniref:hypothetical protein n=1 Tax=Maribacter litoralis TaxID=2059726 RepID=UPI003D2859A3
MRKISYILLLTLFGITAMQAQIDTKAKTVTVTASAPLEKTIVKYRVKATLSMDQVYYADTRVENLEQLKKQYFQELKDLNIDTAIFQEKEMEYFSLGYQRDGTILYYETDSKELAMKLLKTNLLGVQLQFQVKQIVSSVNNKMALNAALENAKTYATELCKTINTSLGDIKAISSSSNYNDDWTSFYADYQEQLTVNVEYNMN